MFNMYATSLICLNKAAAPRNDQMELPCRFSRGSAQTILPPNKNLRAGRLCSSFDNEIKYLERDALEAKEKAQKGRGVKRAKEEELRNLQNMLSSVKVSIPLTLQIPSQ